MKRVLLCIMDGWGINKDCPKDATLTANTPNMDNFYKEEKIFKFLRMANMLVCLMDKWVTLKLVT